MPAVHRGANEAPAITVWPASDGLKCPMTSALATYAAVLDQTFEQIGTTWAGSDSFDRMAVATMAADRARAEAADPATFDGVSPDEAVG